MIPRASRLAFLLLSLLMLVLPLRAQLDPRLQTSNTDFLDLYQQSSNAKVKPEIITVFDFSGSMEALMYHPLFNNTDASDSQAATNMSFTLDPTAGVGANTYVIRATSNQNGNAYATLDVTVGGGIGAFYSNGEQRQSTGSGSRRKYLYTSVTDIIIVGNPAVITPGVNYTFQATVTFRATDASGNPIAVSSYGSVNSTVNWGVSGPSASTINASGVWRAPALRPPSTAYPVTATISGSTVGTLSSIALVKPDGSVVTDADAAAADTSSGFYGAGAGASDVRNWVRAASHARFQYNDGGKVRTIDIPIPWKITDVNSTGNPLSSRTVKDSVTRGTTTIGSGNDMELDLTYKLNGGSYVLSGNSSTQLTTTLSHIDYKKFYIDWLFKGKYTVGTYSGKYIIYDALDASLVGGQGSSNWGKGYGNMGATDTIPVPTYDFAGNYLKEETQPAANNVIPPFSRVQAVKRAAIQTWIQYQDKVIWAFRFLDPAGESVSGTATTIDNDTQSVLRTTDPLTNTVTGNDSGWRLLNNTSTSSTNSVDGMQRIAALCAGGNTPLTYATARALAQFTDPYSVFNAFETGKEAPSQCMNHFLILFTDGIDNNGTGTNNTNGGSPYLVSQNGKIAINALAGNEAIINAKTSIDRYGSNWNLFNFCGIAAHMADTSLGVLNTGHLDPLMPTGTVSGAPSSFLPFALGKRNTTLFAKPHLITTMTVGVSLGGSFTASSSPKRSLFLGAALGDPNTTAWNDIDTLTPFQLETDPTSTRYAQKKNGSIYFFDATNPEKLATDLDKAISAAAGVSNTNTISNPNLPFIGAAYGRQVYLGKFRPPTNGGVIWSGDLMMFGSRQVNDQTVILDQNNNVATVVDASTATWSASNALLNNRLWSQRTLYTRLPGTASNPEPGLSTFTDKDPTFTTLKDSVAKTFSDLGFKKSVIQFAAGGDINGTLDASARPTTNRLTIMGDVINSSPGVLEYKYDDVSSRLPATLQGITGTPKRFRLLLVGTNQGWLHALGEVSSVTLDTATNLEKVEGKVDELWSFMPTDFLANLDYIMVPSNAHRFMVDGTPSIYFLDLPPSTGGLGNGVLDIGNDPATTRERAIAIIGLRKGGRSYYALDIHDPFTPTLKWSLVPDEADNFPASRIAAGVADPVTMLATVKSILKNWGFSTCTPGLGRIKFNGALRDAVFLGGGFSTPEVEQRFPDQYGDPTPLGRSIIALDAYTGEVLAAVDMTAANIGPVAAGLVPFEFILNSGMAQRAYFMGYRGSLWSWGRQGVSAVTPYVDYRQDSSELTEWSVRSVYKDGSGNNALYSTLPAPFRVGTFPGRGKDGAPTPATVGIAMISGDRNNPLDYLYPTGTKPSQHRLTVVFDRQDHKVWDSTDGPITNAQLMDAYPSGVSLQAGDPLITPGSETYYLAPHDSLGNYTTPKLGYYRLLPAASNTFIPKGITSPLVVAGSLFYAYFTPEAADPCTGGSGSTYANLICDGLNPIVEDSRTTVSCRGGNQFTWAGVASDFVTIGTHGVLQAGVVPAVNPAPGQSLTTIQLQTILGNRLERFPRIRTWRTIH